MFGLFGRRGPEGGRPAPAPQEQKREAQFAEGLTTEDSPHLTHREVNQLNRDQGLIPKHSEKPYDYTITPDGAQEPQRVENVPAQDDWEEVEVVDNAEITGRDTTKIYANDNKIDLDGDDEEGQIAAK